MSRQLPRGEYFSFFGNKSEAALGIDSLTCRPACGHCGLAFLLQWLLSYFQNIHFILKPDILLAFYSYEVFHCDCVPVFKAHVHLRLPRYECICLNLNSNHRQGLIVQENVEGTASIRTGTNNDVKICCVHPFLEYHFQHTEKVQDFLYHYLKKSTRFFIIL